jgi:protease YdgD
MKWARWVSRALPLAALAAAPLPGVGPADGRVLVDATAPPWSALARLQIPGVARCTAVLVGQRTAFTAAHCLWSRRLGRFVPPEMVHLLTRYDAGLFAGHAIASGYRIAPDADVALVTLATPLDAPPVLAFAPPPPAGTMAMLGGYNRDRAEVIEADIACHVTGMTNGLIRHDCAATYGTSGAPLLVRGPDGAWRIAGLQEGAFRDRSGGVAVPAATLQAMLNAGERQK